VAAAPVKPAVESAPAPAPIARPVGTGTAPRSAANGDPKGNDEDWWTE